MEKRPYFTPETEEHEAWMRHALTLGARAEAQGEVPVGAVVVRGDLLLGEGWNCPIGTRDPSAHAEIRALRAAAQRADNYRLPGTRLYVTLEPCPMCAGALIQARVSQVIFGAWDPKGGACGSLFDLASDPRLNHRILCTGGLLEAECRDQLRRFFLARRK